MANNLSNQSDKILIVNKPKVEEGSNYSQNRLQDCQGYSMSVAFVTTSGVACIIEQLKNLDETGIRGKILTSTYLNFTQPEALRRLLQFHHLELRIETKNQFHSKGYLFELDQGNFDLVLGSSNLTQSALTTNIELNVKLQAIGKEDEFIIDYQADFKEQWEQATVVDDEFIQSYEKVYFSGKGAISSFQLEEGLFSTVTKQTFHPNDMQVDALEALEKTTDIAAKRINYLSYWNGKNIFECFDVKRVDPKRMLFIVHRRTIAEKSLESYRAIMPEKTMALHRESVAKILPIIFCNSTVNSE